MARTRAQFDAAIANAKKAGDKDAVAVLTAGRDKALPKVNSFEPNDEVELSLAKRAAAAKKAGDEKTYEKAMLAIAARRVGLQHANNPSAGVTQGFGHGFFDLGDHATALLMGKVAPHLSYDDKLEAVRTARQLIEQENPVSSSFGGAIGFAASIIPGTAAAKPVAGVVGAVAPRAVAKTAQVAIPAAIEGAAQGALDADPGKRIEGAETGGTIGAVAGPAISGALKIGGRLAGPVLERFAATNGMKALNRYLVEQAQKAGVTVQTLVDQIRTKGQQIAAEQGREPALAELLPESVARKGGKLIEPHAQAGETAKRLGANVERAQPEGLRTAIMNGDVPVTTADVTAARDASMDAVMHRIGARQVPTGAGAVRFLTSPDVQAALRRNGIPPSLRERIADSMPQLLPNGRQVPGQPLTVRDWDSIRQALDGAFKEGGNHVYADLSRRVMQFTDRVAPQYRAAIDDFALSSQRAEGVTAGRGLASKTGQTAEQMAALDHATPATQRGAEGGIRAGLADAARESPAAAQSTATALEANPGLQGRVTAALGPAEAARLQGVGTRAREAAQGVQAVVPSSVAVEGPSVPAAVAHGATGHPIGALRALASMLMHIGVGRQGADDLAQKLLNPAMRDQAIGEMERYGVDRARASRMLETLGLGAGRALGGSMVPQAQPPVADTPDTATPTSLPTAAPAPAASDYLDRVQQRESNGDPNAASDTSSAAGLHGFTEGTFLQVLKQHGAELGLPKVSSLINDKGEVSDPEAKKAILALRANPTVSRLAAEALTKDNAAALKAHLGRDPNDNELYAAHVMGSGGATKLIDAASQGAPDAASLFPKEAAANKNLFYKGGKAVSAVDLLKSLSLGGQ